MYTEYSYKVNGIEYATVDEADEAKYAEDDEV